MIWFLSICWSLNNDTGCKVLRMQNPQECYEAAEFLYNAANEVKGLQVQVTCQTTAEFS